MFLLSLLFVCSPPTEVIIPKTQVTEDRIVTSNTFFSLFVRPTISFSGYIQLSNIGLDSRCFVSYPNHQLFPDLCILPPHCPSPKHLDTPHNFFSTGLRICYSLSISPGPKVPLYALNYPSEISVNSAPFTFQGRLEYQSSVQLSSYLFSYAGRNFSIPTYCLQYYPVAFDGVNFVLPSIEVSTNKSAAHITRNVYCNLGRLLQLQLFNFSAFANFKSTAGASIIPIDYPIAIPNGRPLHSTSGCDLFPFSAGRSHRLRLCDYLSGVCYFNTTPIVLTRDSIAITHHSFFSNLFNVISSYFLYPFRFVWHHFYLVYHSFYLYFVLSIRYFVFGSIITLVDSIPIAAVATALLVYYDNVWYVNYLNYQDPSVFLDNLML